jgi:hypothetical protein
LDPNEHHISEKQGKTFRNFLKNATGVAKPFSKINPISLPSKILVD